MKKIIFIAIIVFYAALLSASVTETPTVTMTFTPTVSPTSSIIPAFYPTETSCIHRDASFDGDGITADFNEPGGSVFGHGFAMAMDLSGRILVTGQSGVIGNYDMTIWRYNPDGTLDAAFNGTGVVAHNSAAGGNGWDAGFDITTDNSGKILVAGLSDGPGSDDNLAIWRYNPDGTLDTGFSGTGFLIYNTTTGWDAGEEIIVDSFGKIFVAGTSETVSGSDIVVFKLEDNGTPDGGFNGGAPVTFGSAGAAGMAVDFSGKIIITGSTSAADQEMLLVRLNSDGSLDTSFNGSGYVTHNSAAGGTGQDEGKAVIVDSSGRILVTGRSYNSASDYDIVTWRYNSDGTLDTSFNGAGYVIFSNTTGSAVVDEGTGIKIDSSGRILVSGQVTDSSGEVDMIIMRYNDDGTLDANFNGTGFITNNNAAGGSGEDTGRDIYLGADDKIFVAGYSNMNLTSHAMAVWKYADDCGTPTATVTMTSTFSLTETITLTNTPSLTFTHSPSVAHTPYPTEVSCVYRDASFDGDGIVTHNNAAGGNINDYTTGVNIDSSGRLILTGYSWDGIDDDMVTWRYNADGSLDTSFGGGAGYITHDNAGGGNGGDHGYGKIREDSAGRLVMAGYTWNGSNDDMVVYRLNPDGTMDTSFNGTGYATHHNAAGGGGEERAFGIAVDNSDRPIAVGYSFNGSTDDMAIWRFNTDGSLDTSFNGTGYAVFDGTAGGTGTELAASVEVDALGRIVVTGISENASGDFDMVIWRFNDDGSLDTSFNGTGYIVSSSAAGGSGDDSGSEVLIDSAGRIVIAGSSYAGGAADYDVCVWRYLDDGTPDASFGTGGITTAHNGAGFGGWDAGGSLAEDASGNLILAGNSQGAADADIVLWRFNSAGMLDTVFNGTGSVSFDSGTGESILYGGMVLDASGRIIVGGMNYNGTDNDMLILVYTDDCPANTPTITMTQTETLTYTSTLTFTNTLTYTSTPTVTQTSTPGVVDLDIRKAVVSGAVPAPGEIIRYRITIENNDNQGAYNIMVWDTLPGEVEFYANHFSAVAPVINGNFISWDLSSVYDFSNSFLPGSPPIIIEFTVLIQSLAEGHYISNRAGADYNDPYFTAGPHPPIFSVYSYFPSEEPFVYPNPFSPGSEVKFANLPPGALIQVFTISGEFVYAMEAAHITETWDGRNRNGVNVSPGIYYYLITKDEAVYKGKMFVINR